MRISDWSSDVCSSDLQQAGMVAVGGNGLKNRRAHRSRETVSAPKGNHGIQPLSFYSGIQIKAPSALIGGQVSAVAGCDQVKIGRASCRETVCQYVWVWCVAVSLKKKTKPNHT